MCSSASIIINPVCLFFFSMQQFESLGYTRLLLQIGRGTFEPETFITPRFRLEFFRYKDSIAQDIRDAALVISHAGEVVCLFVCCLFVCLFVFCFILCFASVQKREIFISKKPLKFPTIFCVLLYFQGQKFAEQCENQTWIFHYWFARNVWF